MSEVSENAQKLTERKRLIKERQEKSIVWRTVHLFGSLRFALFLLATIAAACAFATFYESRFDTRMTQELIYKSPWFLFWLVFLCVNLICAAATRWPWQRKHTGFVVTHAGIVTLLIGSMIGMIWGYDANVNLHKGRPAERRLVLDEMVMLFEGAKSNDILAAEFEVRVRQPNEENPRRVAVPEQEGLTLVVDDFSDQLVPEQMLVSDELGLAAGIQLEFFSGMMGQTISIPLMSSPAESRIYDLFGLARIVWVDELAGGDVSLGEPFRETQMVIGGMPNAPVVHNSLNKSSGYQFVLDQSPEDNEIMLWVMDPNGEKTFHLLKDVLGKTIPAEAVYGEINVLNFWPDFKMVDGQPTTISEELNNPAVLLMIHGEFREEQIPELLLKVDKERGEVNFEIRRDGVPEQQGIWESGETKAMGWADWQATLKGYYPKAKMVTEVVDASQNEATATERGIIGVRAWLEDAEGNKSPRDWIAMGMPKRMFVGDKNAYMGLSMRTKPIPFGIELLDFEVPRDPGTDTPANYISQVRFVDEAKGVTKEAKIEMNHPASYPGGAVRLLTGVNYKFSQAGWNQENLNETTLQVLYDPGWFFKWTGSLMICVGIYMLFYMRPKAKKKVKE